MTGGAIQIEGMRRASLMLIVGCLACSGAAPEAEPLSQSVSPQAPSAFDTGAHVIAASTLASRPHRAGEPVGFVRRRPLQPGAEATADRTLRVLVVPALFSDSPLPQVTQDQIRDALFGTNSLATYFAQQSRGRLELDGVVTGWLRSSTTLADAVGNEHGLGADAKLGQHLEDVITQASALVTLPDFDNDGPDGKAGSADDDGRIDLVVVLFSELGAPCGGTGPWGHRATLSYWNGGPLVTSTIGKNGAPMVAEDYVLAGATSCGASPRDAIAVLAHELGHALGLPDLYDTSLGYQPDQRKWILGCWDLMAGGAWDCPTVDGLPPPLSAWSSTQLGWSGVQRLPLRSQKLDFKAGSAFAVDSQDGHEVWLEQRHWDAAPGWAPGGGVLAYRVPTAPGGRPVAVFEADGDQALSKPALAGGDRGQATDALAPGQSIQTDAFALSAGLGSVSVIP
ncbi:MAG TPA: M6 family metalloprotease domain-containing protein [Polyangiaceae bacterium]|nr:M6 family metalloprotease domain-containing protein [Polyangiaceae bacterium]